jgi:hypothetical protein
MHVRHSVVKGAMTHRRHTLILLLALLSACGHTSHTVRVVPFVDLTFPPSSSVSIFQIPPEGREYVQIARLSVRGAGKTGRSSPQLLAEKAREIGADAIILLGAQQTGTYMVNPNLGVAINEYSAVAIRFK